MKELIERGASVATVNDKGMCVLHNIMRADAAHSSEHLEIIEMLVKAGAP